MLCAINGGWCPSIENRGRAVTQHEAVIDYADHIEEIATEADYIFLLVYKENWKIPPKMGNSSFEYFNFTIVKYHRT